VTGTCRESPGFVKDAQFWRNCSCYVAAAINDRTRGAGLKGTRHPYPALLEGHGHPTSI